MRIGEYIWIGGNGELRSKTRTISMQGPPPDWGFDGSSTEQASGEHSDCVLKPVKWRKDPIRGTPSMLVLCEVYDSEGNPDKNNYRTKALDAFRLCSDQFPLFGIEQEYTLMKDGEYLGWSIQDYEGASGPKHIGRRICTGLRPPKQGPFYCGVGGGKEYGAEVAEMHMFGCLVAQLKWCGKNSEVMPGQWEFQVGPALPIDVADDLWLARFLLHKVAAKRGYTVTFDAKPHPKLNGAGAHTNFSTQAMRSDGGLEHCTKAAKALGLNVIEDQNCGVEEGKVYATKTFPKEYGSDYKKRLTGEHETCSYNEFKYGVADRTASIRIPLHVSNTGAGYIEDRRPCAYADPYRVVAYMMKICCK